jgi:hypothetical protein
MELDELTEKIIGAGPELFGMVHAATALRA